MAKKELYTIWMRLGIDLIGTKEELQKVKKGDEETLVRLLKAKSFEIWGDSYVPNNDEQVVGFELPTIKMQPSWTARDQGHVDEITTNLTVLAEEYNLILDGEIKWLKELKDRIK